MTVTKQRWEETKQRLPVGTRVHGVVTRVEPFGVFVELTEKDLVAVLLVTHFDDGERSFDIEEYPQIGDTLEGVVVDLAEDNMQVRLSTRPSDMTAHERPS